MKLSPEDKAGLSPSEIAALEGADAETALATMGETAPEPRQAAAADDVDAGDDQGDDQGDEGAAGADGTGEAPTTEPAKADAADGALTAEQLAAIAKDTGAESPKPTTYEVQQRDFAAERKTLRDSRKDIQAKWDSGELSDDQLQAQMDEVDDKLDALASEKASAETLRNINEQNKREAAAKLEAEETAATMDIIKSAKDSKTAPIDYVKDAEAQEQFDLALNMLRANPRNAGKTPTQLVQQAHRSVLAVRGLPTGEPGPKPTTTQAAAPTPQKPRDVPMTLAGLPNASQVPLEDETLTQAARLSGEDLEQFMARLSPAQQAKLMRTVDNRAVSH